jgi:ornithine carbamoyltransferase
VKGATTTMSKSTVKTRHFLDIDAFDATTLRRILDMAHAMKKHGRRPPAALTPKDIADRILVMIFEKPSTRTRVSFEVAMRHLGGQTVSLNATDTQLGRGEPLSDTAKVLSRYADAMMLRVNEHATLTGLAEHSSIPVINGLSNVSHPCQIMADLMTFEEARGPIAGRTVAWAGDGNNVAASWIHAAVVLGFKLNLACPGQLNPPPALLDWAKTKGGAVMLTDDVDVAVKGADCIVTDTWVSMGDKDAGRRKQLLGPYAVDDRVMAQAKRDAIFMHCLPAYRGHEVSASVIDGPQSVVWDEAENRLHAQKAILAWCLGVD